MDTVRIIYSILVMCMINGYVHSVSKPKRTFVLADHACEQSNVTITYEPVPYEDVFENEDSIIELLSDGNSAHVSGYVERLEIKTYGCYKFVRVSLHEESLLGLSIDEFKEKIRIASMEQNKPFQHCINSKQDFALIIAHTCVCVPLPPSFENRYMVETHPQYCLAHGNHNTLNKTEDIYMFRFKLNDYHHFLVDHLTSCHVLTTYTVYGMSYNYYYSRYGLLTDGTICSTYRDRQNKNCDTFWSKRIDLWYDASFCVSNGNNETTIDNGARECGYRLFDVPRDFYSQIYDKMKKNNHHVYAVFNQNRSFLITYDTPKTYKCVSLLRKYDRLFVETERCDNQTKYICRKKLNEKGQVIIDTQPNINNTSSIALTTVCVTVFILLVATSVRVIIVRGRVHQNTDSQNSDTLDIMNAIELHSIGSSHDGSVTGPIPGGSAMSCPIGTPGSSTGPITGGSAIPGPMGTQGSATGPIPGGSAMPGPMGTQGSSTGANTGGSAMQGPMGTQGSSTGSSAGGGAMPGRTVTATPPTTCDQVPGRIPGGYNCHYVQ